jgi:hypothetical protein
LQPASERVDWLAETTRKNEDGVDVGVFKTSLFRHSRVFIFSNGVRRSKKETFPLLFMGM